MEIFSQQDLPLSPIFSEEDFDFSSAKNNQDMNISTLFTEDFMFEDEPLNGNLNIRNRVSMENPAFWHGLESSNRIASSYLKAENHLQIRKNVDAATKSIEKNANKIKKLETQASRLMEKVAILQFQANLLHQENAELIHKQMFNRQFIGKHLG